MAIGEIILLILLILVVCVAIVTKSGGCIGHSSNTTVNVNIYVGVNDDVSSNQLREE